MNILAEADTLVNGPRQADYDHPARDFAKTATMWSAILGCKVKPEDVGLCMIAVKLARESHRHKTDNLTDIAGYAQTVEMVHEELNKVQSTEKSSGFIYLASPYSHPDKAVRQQRFEAVCRVAAKLVAQGENVFSPIAHSHPLAEYGDLPPMDHEMWLRVDLAFLERCREMRIVKLDGWAQSKGVAEEISIADELGKPIRFIELHDLDGVAKIT